MKNYVVLRKIGGFYNVFDDDAIIISYLCNYKVVNNRCGFPINSLDKVINLLEDNKINYKVLDSELEKNYKNNNKYDIVLDKSKKYNSISYRVNSITDNIRLLEYDDLCSLLDIIEDYTNE